MASTGTILFADRNSGTPLYQAELPEDFIGEAVFTPVHYPVSDSFSVRGSAIRPGDSMRLFFQTGEGYFFSEGPQHVPCGSRDEEGCICHAPCDPDVQIREFAEAFLGFPAEVKKLYYLPEKKRQREQKRAEEKAQKIYQTALQIAGMQSVPMCTQAEQIIFDGGTGVFQVNTNAGEKILLVSLWRAGLQYSISVQNAAMFGMAAMLQPPKRMWSWSVPTLVYMTVDPGRFEAGLPLYQHFLDTLKELPALRNFREQQEEQNLQRGLQRCAVSAQQTQAQINYAWEQQQRGWAMSDALSKQISADLDSFHQGIHQQAQAYDRAHGLDFTGGGSGFGSGGESLDDRIQRGRHEAMMGVDTYERDDGTTVEHTTRDDRLFENNLTPTEHFGTEHYYDDYVPDGWTELFRKK